MYLNKIFPPFYRQPRMRRELFNQRIRQRRYTNCLMADWQQSRNELISQSRFVIPLNVVTKWRRHKKIDHHMNCWNYVLIIINTLRGFSYSSSTLSYAIFINIADSFQLWKSPADILVIINNKHVCLWFL